MDDAYLVAKLNMQNCSGVVIKDGVLYSCDTTPKFLNIPKGIVELYKGCLSGQDNLVSVTIPDTVSKVGSYCLANCPNLLAIRCKGNISRFKEILRSGNKGEVIDVHTFRKS